MRYDHKRLNLVALLALFVLVAPTPDLYAQDELPSAEELVQKHIDATGGRAAYDAIQNRKTTMTIEIVGAGIELEATTFAAKPNKVFATVQAPAIGTINKGCTGEVAWSMSDMQGPVIEQGAGLENTVRDSVFDRVIYWQTLYESASCTGVEKVGDRECYKVEFTPPPYKDESLKDVERSVLTVYFDKESGLGIQFATNVVSDAGIINVVAQFSDYRDVDGILIPFVTEMGLVGQKRIMTTKSVEHNLELPADQFDPPQEIQDLLHKQNEAEEEGG